MFYYVIETLAECTLDEIYEGIKTQIPDRIKNTISTKSGRQKMLEEIGKDAFLLPDELKFPVKDPKTGEYDCRLLYAAYIRARQHSKKKPKYIDIADKARKLIEKLGCKQEIGVQIENTEHIIDLYVLLENILISD